MRNRDRERFEKARGLADENIHCHAVHGNARRLVNARACAAGSSDRVATPHIQAASRRRTSGRAATLNGQAALRWLARRRCVSVLRMLAAAIVSRCYRRKSLCPFRDKGNTSFRPPVPG